MRSAVTLLLLAAAPLAAQTPAKPTPHPTATAHPTARVVPCAKLPELSPKLPAIPAGLPCAKPLYTITSVPAIKLDYVSPLEGSTLRETLGIEPATFSLNYIDTKIGTGPVAVPHKFYTVNYTGYLTDGTKFDSSLDHGDPIVIQYGQHQVIPGWDTGFDGMHVGGKRRLFIPYQLAYGTKGSPPVIPPQAELVFDVELVAQSDTRPEPKPAPVPPPQPTAPAAAPAAPATPPPATKPQP